jgi:hypothetical protein
MSRPGFDFKGRPLSHDVLPTSTRDQWRSDARPTNHDSAREAVLNRRIIHLLDALDAAEQRVEAPVCDCPPDACLSAGAIGCYFGCAESKEAVGCAMCSGRGVWMDEPCSDCAPRALERCLRRQCRGRIPHSRLVHWLGWVRR